jgi:hypothetical protein
VNFPAAAPLYATGAFRLAKKPMLPAKRFGICLCKLHTKKGIEKERAAQLIVNPPFVLIFDRKGLIR